MNTLTPTVLVVDDDPSIIRTLQKNILSETLLGVAAVSTLEYARKLIKDKRYEFNAIISDLFFEQDSQAHSDGLVDGIDFLEYADKVRPGLDKYVISVFSDYKNYRSHANEAQLDINHWYEKLDIKNTRPWLAIEKELFAKKLRQSECGREILKQTENANHPGDFMSMMHECLRPMTRSYLTCLPDESLRIVNPITVIGREEEGVYYLSALNIGLTQSGAGDDFGEAMDHLKELIVSHYENICEISVENPSDITDELKSAVDHYVRPIY